MLQLGALERVGYIRLDQVWSAPTNEELAEIYLVAKQMMLDVLDVMVGRVNTARLLDMCGNHG
jgi:hypothetical protein